jgi:transcription initiation factor TFIIB
MLNFSESIKCSVCGSDRMHTAIADPESGEEICSNCDLVIAEKDIDLANPERCIFTAEESNQRVRTGARTSLSRYDRGLPILRKTNMQGIRMVAGLQQWR